MKHKKKLALAGVASLTVAGVPVFAAENEYVAQLNDALTSVQGIWTAVATIIIGVAIVTVGTRFFRKAK